MANPPSPPWWLPCRWCDYRILVNARGAHGNDPGSGVEAAKAMTRHVERKHNHTWKEWLASEPRALRANEQDARWIVGQWQRLPDEPIKEVALAIVDRVVAALEPRETA